MQRILIVRLGSLGDIVHTLPAAATLKHAFPRAEIDWVVEGTGRRCWNAILTCRNCTVWRRAPGGGGWRKPGTWRALLGSISKLRRCRYDCALDFQGLVKSALVGAPERRNGGGGVRARGIARRVCLRLLHRAGRPPGQRASGPRGGAEPGARHCRRGRRTGGGVFLLARPQDAERMRATTSELGDYAVVSPSAGWAAKRWPEEAYAALVVRFSRELGLAVVINCGPGEEPIAGRVAELAAAARPVLLQPSLGELIALVRDAALLVGGDTGPLHLAAVCGTPVVAIFGPTDPVRNGPFGPSCRVVRAEEAATTYSRAADRQAIRRITVEQVFQATRELLRAR